MKSNFVSAGFLLICLLSVCTCIAQSRRGVQFKFQLDTASNQVLPFDLPSFVSVLNNKTNPNKFYYLFRVNRWGIAVPDRNTSYFKTYDREKRVFEPNLDRLPSVTQSTSGDSAFIDLPALRPNKQYVLMAARPDIGAARKLAEDYCKGATIADRFPNNQPTAILLSKGNRASRKRIKANCIADQRFRKRTLRKSISDESDQAKKAQLEAEKDAIKVCRKCRYNKTKHKFDNLTAEEQQRYEKLLVSQGAKIQEALKRLQSGFNYCNPPVLVTNSKVTHPISDTPEFELSGCDTCKIKMNVPARMQPYFVNGIKPILSKWESEVILGTYKLDTVKTYAYLIVDISTRSETDQQRIDKLVKSIGIIVKVKQAILNYYPDLNAPGNLITSLNEYIDAMKDNLSIYERRAEFDQKLVASLSQMNLAMQSSTILSKGTSSYRFVTRNSFFIVPDFGLMYTGSKLFKASSFQTVTPFVGFHVLMRAVNRNVPFYKNFNAWKLPVLQIGVPIFGKNLSSDGTRKELVGDKFSMFGGIGINLAHSVRITYGAFLFQSLKGMQNGAPTYKISATPYISVGIDIRLRPLFYGLSDALSSFKLPQ